MLPVSEDVTAEDVKIGMVTGTPEGASLARTPTYLQGLCGRGALLSHGGVPLLRHQVRDPQALHKQ
jgi:hypothetical protein